MKNTNIAIVGLGNIGSFFLQQLIQRFDLGLSILCAVEPKETDGKRMAQQNGVAIVSIDDLISFGDDVDMIFNLTGSDAVQQDIREKMDAAGNTKTELLSETALKIVWSILSDEPIPD